MLATLIQKKESPCGSWATVRRAEVASDRWTRSGNRLRGQTKAIWRDLKDGEEA